MRLATRCSAACGEVLGKAIDKPSSAARIGGDEFALLLPGVDAQRAARMVMEVRGLVDLNNQFYPGMLLEPVDEGAAAALPANG